MEAPKPQAVVVGGSIAGLSCAHALISAGWRVTVFEKSASPPDGSPTGAGLCLDTQSLRFLSQWVSDPHLLDVTSPLSIDLNRLTDSGTKDSRTLTRDGDFDFRAAHWADLHSILLRTLPPGTVLWGHQFMSFEVSDGRSSVVTKARVLRTDEIIGIASDLVVAADGCLSSIRRQLFPNSKLRYSGYYAWRGILDFSGKENDDIILGLRQSYPNLADCLYFDLALATHCVLYELKGHRLNWLWYINGPEPERKESSLTVKVSDSMIEMMHEEADKVWVPELARVMKETKEPFINIIYDSDPLPKLFQDNVVLVGDAAHPTTPHGLRSTNMSIQDAAHPTTPHGLRSTNMSIQDAAALGCCLKKWGWENLSSALKEYQSIRLPVISKQVLHARKLGRIKQGLALNCGKTFDPTTARQEECLQLQQRSMPYFEGVPITFDNIITPTIYHLKEI